MAPLLGGVELFGLCGRPTVRLRVFWKPTLCGEPARGNGKESDWHSELLFSEEVYILVNFFQKKGVTLPITFLALSSRGFATRCPFPEHTTRNSWAAT